MEGIRVGRVSSINYEKGMVRVVYADRDNSVTDDLPYLTMNGEYKMPQINDLVLVLCLSNGATMGIVLGTFWSSSRKPLETGPGVFRKELSNILGEAFFRYDTDSKTLTIKADTVQVENSSGITILGEVNSLG